MTKDQIYELILDVALATHDDISKQDEDNVSDCADEIYAVIKDLREKCWVLQRKWEEK